MVKKFALLTFSCISVLVLSSCSVKVTGINNYQRMYTVVNEWNKQTDSSHRKDNLFGFGEYLYNSYLILFPRETPTKLTDFYFKWSAMIDVDLFAVYFTCQLDETNYVNFINGLNNFSFSFEENTTYLLYDNEHFDYPAYILQWMNPTEKWEVYEYILLDEKNHTFIFVYNTLGGLDDIVKYASYNVEPNCNQEDVIDDELKNVVASNSYDGFSIYLFKNSTNQIYDNSFLSYLF